MTEHLVIVGGGPAGLATARAYREAGAEARVTMLTSEPYAPYRRPPLTKEYLRGEASREDLPIESDGWYEENDVELRLITARRAGQGAPDRRLRTRVRSYRTTPACWPRVPSRFVCPFLAPTTPRS